MATHSRKLLSIKVLAFLLTFAGALNLTPISAQAVAPNHTPYIASFETTDATAHSTAAGTYCETTPEISTTPPTGGSSSSTKAGKVTTLNRYWGCAGYPLWTFIDLGANAANESLASASNQTVTMNFYSITATNVMLQLTSADGSVTKDSSIVTTTRSGWQSITLTFSGLSDSIAYTKATIFPRANNMGAGTFQDGLIYYIDDVAFNGATTPAVTQLGAQIVSVNLDVRLSSAQKNTAVDTREVISPCSGVAGNDWCVNNKYFMKMIPAGSTTRFTYVVTEHGSSTVVAGATVKLRVNTGYSGSNATWINGQTTFGAVAGNNPNDAGFLTGTTDGSGEVSFDLTNTNTSGEVARVLNSANPYPTGCFSPEGQTKAALEPVVTAITGPNYIGSQYVDVLWPHISSTTINTSIGRGSDGVDCNARVIVGNQKNKGEYPHLRLESSFLDTYFDASWWDGVWQNRDADTQAFLKYIPVGSTFKLTYVVTGNDNYPLADAPVSLIVNANYSCAKTFFMYENTLIGPDDCAGGGQTELPAKKTDSQGRVSFVLTNTNSVGEAMPLDLNGLPNGKVEVGTNIKPHLVGATKEGIDMLFAHFVQPTEKASVSAPAASSVAAGGNAWSTFTFTDENGAAIANTEVAFMINGFESKTGYAKTDASGKVVIRSANPTSATGQQVVAVSLIRPGKLPITGSTKVNWISPVVTLAASGAKGAVVVSVTSANGKSVKISIGGKVYTRTAASDSATFSIPATAGAKRVVVTVGTKSVTKTVTVSK